MQARVPDDGSEPIPVPPNTVMRWGVHPGAVGSIKMLEGMATAWPKLPRVGQVLTLPFLVDPQTLAPVPVLVLELQTLLHLSPPTIAIVVGRRH